MNDSKPFHVRVAEALIDQLKAGTAPWQRPWADGVPTLPMNPVTGARYRGINTLQLLLQDHSDPRWMTYRQAQQLGAQVRKGERGASVHGIPTSAPKRFSTTPAHTSSTAVTGRSTT